MMWFMAIFVVPKDPSDVVVTIEAEDNHNFKDLLSKLKVPTSVIGGVENFFI